MSAGDRRVDRRARRGRRTRGRPARRGCGRGRSRRSCPCSMRTRPSGLPLAACSARAASSWAWVIRPCWHSSVPSCVPSDTGSSARRASRQLALAGGYRRVRGSVCRSPAPVAAGSTGSVLVPEAREEPQQGAPVARDLRVCRRPSASAASGRRRRPRPRLPAPGPGPGRPGPARAASAARSRSSASPSSGADGVGDARDHLDRVAARPRPRPRGPTWTRAGRQDDAGRPARPAGRGRPDRDARPRRAR